MSDLNLSVRQLLRFALHLPPGFVREANQNFPSGTINQPYATVLIFGYQAHGWDDVVTTPLFGPSLNQTFGDGAAGDGDFGGADPVNDLTETVSGMRVLTVSVQFFREGALGYAQRVLGALQTSAAAAQAQQLGLGLIKVSSVRNLSAAINTYWEERAQVDIDLSTVIVEANDLPTFGTFPIVLAPNRQ